MNQNWYDVWTLVIPKEIGIIGQLMVNRNSAMTVGRYWLSHAFSRVVFCIQHSYVARHTQSGFHTKHFDETPAVTAVTHLSPTGYSKAVPSATFESLRGKV